jgi:hypothetical protein
VPGSFCCARAGLSAFKHLRGNIKPARAVLRLTLATGTEQEPHPAPGPRYAVTGASVSHPRLRSYGRTPWKAVHNWDVSSAGVPWLNWARFVTVNCARGLSVGYASDG